MENKVLLSQVSSLYLNKFDVATRKLTTSLRVHLLGLEFTLGKSSITKTIEDKWQLLWIPQSKIWNTDSTKILLELGWSMRVIHRHAPLSLQKRWTLVEKTGGVGVGYPTLLKSVLKVGTGRIPLSRSRRGPTYISIVTVLDRVVSLEGPGPVVLTE